MRSSKVIGYPAILSFSQALETVLGNIYSFEQLFYKKKGAGCSRWVLVWPRRYSQWPPSDFWKKFRKLSNTFQHPWVLNNTNMALRLWYCLYSVCTQKLAVQLFNLFKWIRERSGNIETNNQTHKNVWENQMIEICWLRLRGQVKGKTTSCFLCSNMGKMSGKFTVMLKKKEQKQQIIPLCTVESR